jgi:hypothetical protein
MRDDYDRHGVRLGLSQETVALYIIACVLVAMLILFA